MIFSLDVRRARKGDCMMLHYGTKADPRLVMIDGGPKDVYRPHLKPRILQIKQARGLPGEQPLPVDMLMVSHVDDDHIQGILDLTKELTADPNKPRLLQVQSLWHNSFDDIIGNDPAELTASVTAQFGPASVSGSLPPKAAIDLGPNASEEEEEIAADTLLVLASIAQGHRLRGDAQALGWQLNLEHNGKLVLADKKALDLGNGLKLTVVGPMHEELQELQKKHDEWLEEKKKKKKSNEAALAAYVDESVANLSSIVVLAECEGKRMLLTGDARGDKILEGLEATGLLKKNGGTMHVDLLKVPHHGSANNLDDDFFERISADHYVFSGDGEHGNPERESMEMLLKARGKKPLSIHLTYPVAEIDKGRKADWQMQQAKEKAKKAKGGKKPVRPNWSPAKHGLAALLKAKLAKGQKLHIVDKAKPHVIDLRDPLGY